MAPVVVLRLIAPPAALIVTPVPVVRSVSADHGNRGAASVADVGAEIDLAVVVLSENQARGAIDRARVAAGDIVMGRDVDAGGGDDRRVEKAMLPVVFGEVD